MKSYFILGCILQSWILGAQVPVIDISVLGKVVEDVAIATEHLNQAKLQVERLGNPSAIHISTAGPLIQSLSTTGIGQTLVELRTAASGKAGQSFDGDGLYRVPGPEFSIADGTTIERAIEPYRKFDAITRARAALEEVMRDTEERRQKLRAQIKSTVSLLEAATTVAEVQKLGAILLAQNSELNAVDREREAALSRLLTQQIDNQNDVARQEFARLEERAADLRTAELKLGNFLIPNTSPVLIPDVRNRQP